MCIISLLHKNKYQGFHIGANFFYMYYIVRTSQTPHVGIKLHIFETLTDDNHLFPLTTHTVRKQCSIFIPVAENLLSVYRKDTCPRSPYKVVPT